MKSESVRAGVAGGVILLIVAVCLAAAERAEAGSLEPRKPSELVVLTVSNGTECPCNASAHAVVSMHGIDGVMEPFALGEREAVILSGATLNSLGEVAGANHFVSVQRFPAGCAGQSGQSQITESNSSGDATTVFDFGAGLGVSGGAVLCVEARTDATVHQVTGSFQGFRTRNR